MAGFKVHFLAAAITGGCLGTAMLQSGMLEPHGVLAAFFLTSFGGVVPDLDADHSIVLATATTVMAVVVSFLAMFHWRQGQGVVELIALWFGCYLFFKWVVLGFVTRLTVHRGIVHSIPAAILGGIMTVLFLHDLLGWPDHLSWLGGGFFWTGYMVHLTVDELTGLKVFRLGGFGPSLLGRALKFRGPGILSTVAVYLAIFLAIPFLPELAALGPAVTRLSAGPFH
ncbi:MAG: metal-dependent hydrolase [Magnetococcales bacterium]|nr:metal-dependent hydrolase [Magnetococcales bacterium]